MKEFILSLIIALIISSADSQTKKTDVEDMKLKGNVKSVRETSYEAITKSGSVQKGKRKRGDEEFDSFTTFNGKGNATEKLFYLDDGTVTRKWIYHYDGMLNEIEVNKYKPDSSSDGQNKYTYTYDKKGNLVEKKHLTDGTYDDGYFYKYDDKGNLIEEDWHKADGTAKDKSIYRYDDKGNQIEEADYKPDGSLSLKVIFLYNDKGNNVEETGYKAGTKFIIKYKNTYDEQGNLTEVDWCKSGGKVYTKFYLKYAYDKYGNWTTQTLFKGDKAKYILEREIAYF